MNNTEHLLGRINHQYQSFSKGQKNWHPIFWIIMIRRHFLQQSWGDSRVSESAVVVRFAIHLGYKGYGISEGFGRTGTQ